MIIQKVLNSSVVLAKDDDGLESVILGKGIGYGRKPGEEFIIQSTDRIFIPLSSPDARPMMELLSETPADYIELTQDIVKDAENSLGVKLSSHIYLSLTDHLGFAIQRQKQNLIVTNQIIWEIRHFYRREYEVGLRALDKIYDRLKIRLPEEEAGNIAFHIVNARVDQNKEYDAMRAAKMIKAIMNIVFYGMNCSPDENSINYVRFVNHLRYFTERFFSGKLLKSKDNFLYSQMEKEYPEDVRCAQKIKTYCSNTYHIVIPDEEVAYIALHIARLVRETES